MNDLEVLSYAAKIVEGSTAASEVPALDPHNFLRYVAYVRDVLRYEWTTERRASEPLMWEFCEGLKRLTDDFEERRARDPAILYRPMNPKALAFHSSRAFIRYFKAGNRTSKTTSGYLEDYLVATGQSIYRPIPAQMNAVFIVGFEYSKYAPKVFEPKMLEGEQDNILSPLFPTNGKWFYHYDQKTRQITLRCRDCAETKPTGECAGHHKKGYITLFSDEGGSDVIEGFTAQHGHLDELVRESFFGASVTRLMSAQDGTLAITCTPRYGRQAWQRRLVDDVANGPPEDNVFYSDSTQEPIKYAEVFKVTMAEGGVVSPAKAKVAREKYDSEFERRARCDGEDSPLATNPVFSLVKLDALRSGVRNPEYGRFRIADDPETAKPLELDKLFLKEQFTWEPQRRPQKDEKHTGWRIWEHPIAGAKYIMGVDSANGLVDGDASCATIVRISVVSGKLRVALAAKYHGWITTYDYADQVKLGGIYYNDALAVVETTGIGRAVMDRLRRQIFYANLFRDMTAPALVRGGADSRIGMDTNYTTKPAMVASAQYALLHDQLEIPDVATLEEMAGFEQERTDLGIQTRYRGSGGTPDDMVMALILAVHVAFTQPMFTVDQLQQEDPNAEKEDLDRRRAAKIPAAKVHTLNDESAGLVD